MTFIHAICVGCRRVIGLLRGRRQLNENMSVGRLELPTNGLKGHCSTIELHAHNQVIIVARDPLSVNMRGNF